MAIRTKNRHRRIVWLELATINDQAHLTLRLPKRGIWAGIVLATTLWGGPEMTQLLRSLL